MKKLSMICLFIFILMLIGCQQNETKQPKTSEDQQETTSEELEDENSEESEIVEEENTENLLDEAFMISIDDTAGWMLAGPGKYAGNQKDIEKIKEEIKNWPQNISEEEYFQLIVSLTAEDYTPYIEYLEEVEVIFDEISKRPDGKVSDKEVVQEETGLNVAILLDASGSMTAELDGKPKMDHAKEAVLDFATELPENARVSLTVYGHKGTNTLDGKETSCTEIEEVYPLDTYNEASFSLSLNQFEPTGYTPIAAAIESAGESLTDNEHSKNVIYVVSDGKETCGGDPAAEAKKLQESDIDAIANIIGFDIEEEERAALEAIAEAGNGKYLRANTAQELHNELKRERQELRFEWMKWSNDHVGKYIHQQNEYVNKSLTLQTEAQELTREEQELQNGLADYLEEVKQDVDGNKIRNFIRRRASDMRSYLRQEFYPIRQEAREKGYELREKVRKESREKRDELKEEN